MDQSQTAQSSVQRERSILLPTLLRLPAVPHVQRDRPGNREVLGIAVATSIPRPRVPRVTLIRNRHAEPSSA